MANSTIDNPREYSERETSNFRIAPELKEKLRKLADARKVTMSDIIDDLVRELFAKESDRA